MIITNKLNFRFLKIITKSTCLNSISAKIRSLVFINTVIKSFKFGLKNIFLEESNVQIQNNHLKIWRKKELLNNIK